MNRPKKQEMIKRVKEYEKYIKNHDEYIHKEYTVGEDNFANIEVHGYENLEWYDPLSGKGEQCELNSEIYDYIDKKAFHVPYEYPLRIVFKNCTLSDDEQPKIEKLLREHYTRSLWDTQNKLKYNKMVAIGLAVLGALLLIFAFSLQTFGVDRVFSEMAMIVATFTFWEAADFAMLKKKDLQIERIYNGQLASSEVLFESSA